MVILIDHKLAIRNRFSHEDRKIEYEVWTWTLSFAGGSATDWTTFVSYIPSLALWFSIIFTIYFLDQSDIEWWMV